MAGGYSTLPYDSKTAKPLAVLPYDPRTAKPFEQLGSKMTPNTGGVTPPQYTPEQQSAQSWINNPTSGQGGLNAYSARQNERYAGAFAANNTDLTNRLTADAARVGYTLNKPDMPQIGASGAPQSGGDVKPKFDAAGIADSKVAAQRAAVAGSVNAYDKSRTDAYKYAQGTTQGNRALLQFDNSNRGDQFGGSAREDLFRLQRSQGLEDTYANTQYQNDIAASDAKLQAFDAGAAGKQQDIQQQLEHQNFTDTLATNQDTRAQQTQDHGFAQDTITNNRNAANDAATYTGNYTSPQTTAIQQQMAKNSAAYATASPDEQNRLHDENVALGKQLGKTYDPKTGTYSGGNTSTRTVAGQTLDANHQKDMATLTGYMPDGRGGWMPTNAKQQEILTNAWKTIDSIGYVPNNLEKVVGVPAGTPTQQAKNQAIQSGISQQNADASTKNATTNADELQYKKDNPTSKPVTVDSKVSTDNHATISGDIKDAKDADEANALIEANRSNLTDADYKDLKKQVIDKF